jgi:uncharacterized protein
MRWIIASAIIVAAILNSGSAFAQNIDCAKANIAVLRIICADSELQELQREFSSLFQNVATGLAGADRDTATQEQIKWVNERNAQCNLIGKDNERIEVLLKAKPCVMETIRTRISFLKTEYKGLVRTPLQRLPVQATPKTAPKAATKAPQREGSTIQEALQNLFPGNNLSFGRQVIIGEYALQNFTNLTVDTGGVALLKRDAVQGKWRFVGLDGGGLSLADLVRMGVPQNAATALLEGLSPEKKAPSAITTALTLYGVKIGDEVSKVRWGVGERFEKLPNVVRVGQFDGSAALVYAYNAVGGTVAYAELYNVNDVTVGPVVWRMYLRFYQVDQDYVIGQLIQQLGRPEFKRDGWCAQTLRWNKGAAWLEICRGSETTVGEVQITMEDKDFLTRTMNAAQAGNAVKPNMR